MRCGVTLPLLSLSSADPVSPSEATLSSDFIAGFCGETEEDHRETLSLMEAVQFDMAYMYAYSMRKVLFVLSGYMCVLFYMVCGHVCYMCVCMLSVCAVARCVCAVHMLLTCVTCACVHAIYAFFPCNVAQLCACTMSLT